MKKKNDEYSKQMRLSIVNLLGEMPNFCALLFSAISTKAVLVLVDLLDTASNVLRNVLIVLISRKLRKDLRFQYNYGVGKIEAMSTLVCDSIMMISLLVMFGLAIHDLIEPRPAEGFMIFALCVKIVNVLGDVYMFFKQRRLAKTSDSLVFKSAFAVSVKNLIFDLTSLVALILMNVFADVKAFWYVSPVVSIILGSYLIYTTVKRMNETIGVMLDKSADEKTQMAILQTLTTFYEKYDEVENIQSHVSSGTVYVDFVLTFSPDMTYTEMKEIADQFYTELSKKVAKCEVSLRIIGTNKEVTVNAQ